MPFLVLDLLQTRQGCNHHTFWSLKVAKWILCNIRWRSAIRNASYQLATGLGWDSNRTISCDNYSDLSGIWCFVNLSDQNIVLPRVDRRVQRMIEVQPQYLLSNCLKVRWQRVLFVDFFGDKERRPKQPRRLPIPVLIVLSFRLHDGF